METKHVVQAPIEYSLCSGCGSCEIVCSLTHNRVVSPSYRRIFVELGPGDEMIHKVLTCQQCEDHPCFDACPEGNDAMHIDENGIVYVDEENCIGCGLCRKACPLDPPRIIIARNKETKERAAVKCDLCRNRPEGPACVEYCQAVCLGVAGTPLAWEESEEEVA